MQVHGDNKGTSSKENGPYSQDIGELLFSQNYPLKSLKTPTKYNIVLSLKRMISFSSGIELGYWFFS